MFLRGSGDIALRALLTEAREAEGLTQEQLARRLNKPRSFVWKLENGERVLAYAEAPAYARALGLKFSEFSLRYAALLRMQMLPTRGPTRKRRKPKSNGAQSLLLNPGHGVPVAIPDVGLLLQQTVVQRGAKTTDGHIVEAVTLPWFDIIAAMQRDPELPYKMPWERLEELVAGAYKRAGFEDVTLTPRSGDRGRDVIATKYGLATIRVIESVKRYGRNNPVRLDDVRALLGVLEGDGASKAFLTTTSDFAPGIRQDALLKPLLGPRLELVNGEQLLARLVKLAKR